MKWRFVEIFNRAVFIAFAQALLLSGFFAGKSHGGTPENSQTKQLNLFEYIDTARDAIRGEWTFSDSQLKSVSWQSDYGPFIQIPVEPNGSYRLRVDFSFLVGPDALYMHIPIGRTWVLLTIGRNRQTIADVVGRGEIGSDGVLAVGKHAVELQVSRDSGDTVEVAVSVDGRGAIAYRGPNSQLQKGGPPVWSARQESTFAIGSKSAIISTMMLSMLSGQAISVRPSVSPTTRQSLEGGLSAASLDKLAYDAARAATLAQDICLANFQKTEQYKRLKSRIDANQAALEQARQDGGIENIESAARTLLMARHALTEAENIVLLKDSKVTSTAAAAAQAEKRAKLAHQAELDEAIARKKQEQLASLQNAQANLGTGAWGDPPSVAAGNSWDSPSSLDRARQNLADHLAELQAARERLAQMEEEVQEGQTENTSIENAAQNVENLEQWVAEDQQKIAEDEQRQ